MSRLLQTGLNAGKDPLIKVIDGEGVYFVLADGRRLIDGSNTGGPLGHKHPVMVEAMKKAASNPVINEGWFWAEREAAAEDLIDIAFGEEKSWVGAVRFFLSGSEANDLALTFCQALTGRRELATRERAYHGMAGLARQMTVQPHWHGGLALQGGGSKPVPSQASVRILPAPLNAKYGGVSDNRPLAERMAGTEEILSSVAATIIDYTQGGIYYDSGYQDYVANAARKAGSLWIADEVVTGLGRSGRWFAFQGGETRPDIVTLGKCLAGGSAPAGAVVMSKDVVDQMKDKSWQTYSTFRAHPSAVSAIRAYLSVMADGQIIRRVKELETRMQQRLVEIARKHPSVARVDGFGLHWTIELHGPDWRHWYADTIEAPIASRVAAQAIEAGAVIGTSGEQTSLFLAPSFIISDDELDTLISALDHGLELADAEFERGAA
ncbi:aminotransferase class III-fold pyridoxal phosphate-dependent enzyme [Mesorhizobium sp.]|uniref:aminotransferase class III-fold pyridoxal phosphate-dependent enzyme n=1 Tax=Mesorhizobium sp. TaxID=1871066 RepID=UPI000FE83041|nr:aminotransferase class III-fold pyridoxal phosphate-dependent enzyme [Mesorhizobium sp.]RWP01142.1 MAG: aminotransferase class III-fold pyridoxal phosphate-dependent enzyme [Mesorhizobium sp.]